MIFRLKLLICLMALILVGSLTASAQESRPSTISLSDVRELSHTDNHFAFTAKATGLLAGDLVVTLDYDELNHVLTGGHWSLSILPQAAAGFFNPPGTLSGMVTTGKAATGGESGGAPVLTDIELEVTNGTSIYAALTGSTVSIAGELSLLEPLQASGGLNLTLGSKVPDLLRQMYPLGVSQADSATASSQDETPGEQPFSVAGEMAQNTVDQSAQTSYSIADLGTLGGTTSNAIAVNNAGQVIGSSTTANGQPYAFLYSGGHLTELSLGGSASYVQAINNAGQAIGYSYISNGQSHAFLYGNGQIKDLGTLGGTTSYSTAINTAGQVIGYSYLPDIQQYGFLYNQGPLINLNLGGTYSNATAINGAGEVVGNAQTVGGQTHAFLYSNGQATDLGTLGGANSYAIAINTAGQTVGYSTTANGQQHAFLYSNGQMTDLGTLGGTTSNAIAVNDAGQVIGSSTTANGQQYAFLYSNGQMTKLTLGGASSYSTAVNNAGQVIGYSFTASGHQHAFLYSNGQMIDLTPQAQTSNAVALNSTGQVIGYSIASSGLQGFLYDQNNGLQNLSALIPSAALWSNLSPVSISDQGLIAGTGTINKNSHAFLISPSSSSDTIPPVTTDTPSPLPNSAGWNNTDANITLTATDNPGGSGVHSITYSASGAQTIASTTVNGSSASFTITAEGATTVTFHATDNAGNVEAPHTLVIKIDKTPPALSCGAADQNWHASDVSIPCTAHDTGSGLLNSSNSSFSLSTSVPSGTETSSAATSSLQVCDVAGNCATAGPIGGNKIDKKPPTITISTPQNNATYVLNQVVAASFQCADGGAGLASCVSTAKNGYLDTSSPGVKSFTVTGTDKVGNTATTSVNYTVTGMSLSLSPSSVTGGVRIPATITLSSPAPSGGAKVTLQNSNPAIVIVPGSTVVPAGKTSVVVLISTLAVSKTVTANIQAAYNGQTSMATLTVMAPVLKQFTVNTRFVPGGCGQITAHLALNGIAPQGGATISLVSTNPALSVSNVTIPAGASTAIFMMNATEVTSVETGTVTAGFGGVALSQNLSVRPIQIATISLNPNPVKGGKTVAGTVTLECADNVHDTVVTLVSNNPAVANPAASSITIRKGSTAGKFSVMTYHVTTSSTIRINATVYSATTRGNLTITP